MTLAGSTSCVKELLKHGADVNAVTDHGLRPLHLAKALRWKHVGRLLLANGAR